MAPAKKEARRRRKEEPMRVADAGRAWVKKTVKGEDGELII